MKKTSGIDALFALPLAEFTAARNSLAARLKKEGRTAEAERVKAMPKPPATAWAVNQLFWRQPNEVERLLTIGETVRQAQSGKAADLRGLLEKQKRELETRSRSAQEDARAASSEAKKCAQAVADAERALNRARAALA